MPPTPGSSVAVEAVVPGFQLGYQAGNIIAQRYRLEEPIGFGGMGTVWRAHNLLLDAPLAVKLLRSTVHRSGSSERLLLEAKASACLRHPAIVRVYDFGLTEQGDPFLAMELLHGESLREVLDRDRAVPAPRAIRLLLPILAGLACAHSRGIVHRDLKPDNIFLARDDAGRVEPKVVDFGIAKFQGATSRITTAGVLLGSPSYMSPEQAMGEEDIDSRADVWSIAVVLYEVIAGKAPWEAPNCPALLRAIVDDPPPSLVGVGGVDAELWETILHALGKRREDRWSSCRDMGYALAAWLRKKGIDDDFSGTSLETAWPTDPESDDENPSLQSSPQIWTTPTLEEASPQITVDLSRVSGKRRRRLTLAIGIPLVACLMLLQMGFGTSRPPEAPIGAILTDPLRSVASFPPPSLPPPEIEVSGDLPAPLASSVAPPARSRTAERRPRGTPPFSSSARAPAPKAPLAPPGSARAMDFGF
jgi:serine/threonine-protein kinase